MKFKTNLDFLKNKISNWRQDTGNGLQETGYTGGQPSTVNSKPLGAQLPVNQRSVAKSKQLDKVISNPSPVTSHQTNINSKKSPSLRDRFNKFQAQVVGCIMIFALFALCFVFLLFSYVFNFDNNFADISLEGRITDPNGTPVANAEIYISDILITSTNQEGDYLIENMGEQRISLKVIKEGFQEYKEDFEVKNSFLNFSLEKDIVLRSAEIAQLQGKFIADDENYKFTNDEILIDDKSYRVNPDGSFNIEGPIAGLRTFEFKSSNYVDITEAIDILPGKNLIDNINLAPAGDIVGKLENYLTDELVTDVQIQVNGVLAEDIEISEDSNITIRDLEIGKEYSIRITKDEFEPRDYELLIKKGNNVIDNLNLVPVGKAAYISSENRNRNFNISDLDGSDNKLANSILEYRPSNVYLDEETNKIFFTSSEYRLRGNLSSNLGLVYEYNINDGKITRITNLSENTYGRLIPFYKAKKFVDINGNNRESQRTISTLELNGTGRSTFRTANNVDILEVRLSDNAEYIASLEEDTETEELRIYYSSAEQEDVFVTSKQELDIQSISPDGKSLIYSGIDDSTKLNTLYLYNIETRQTTPIIRDQKGSFYNFMNNTEFIFLDSVNNRPVINKFNIQNLNTQELLRFSSTEEITSLYLENDRVFYLIEDKGLYVFNLELPKTYKIVYSGNVEERE